MKMLQIFSEYKFVRETNYNEARIPVVLSMTQYKTKVVVTNLLVWTMANFQSCHPKYGRKKGDI